MIAMKFWQARLTVTFIMVQNIRHIINPLLFCRLQIILGQEMLVSTLKEFIEHKLKNLNAEKSVSSNPKRHLLDSTNNHLHN